MNEAETRVEHIEPALKADEVFTGLLDYGLFSDKVPPCFVSQGLASFVTANILSRFSLPDEGALKKEIKKCTHDYIRYAAQRNINIPRHFGIPHPESYAAQVWAIKNHWDEINTHCAKPTPKISRIYVRRHKQNPISAGIDMPAIAESTDQDLGNIFQMSYGVVDEDEFEELDIEANETSYSGEEKPKDTTGCHIFKMSAKGSDSLLLEEKELSWKAGMQYLIKADIASCFPSIYTHSIPWALTSVEEAKTNRSFTSTGNILDACTQLLRDGQTNGLLIGPHSSNIISEIILTKIDEALIAKGYTRLKRHIDDYEYYAENHDEADRFVHDLNLILRKYELTLNPKKLQILSLPRPSQENWVRQLNQYPFALSGTLSFSVLRQFLDLALELSEIAGTFSPLYYAIKMTPNRLNGRAKKLYVQETINLALSLPYLVPQLDVFVFDRYSHEGIKDQITQFVRLLLKQGIQKLHLDSIAYSLYFTIKHKIVLSELAEQYQDILNIDDCLVNVLMLEYATINREAAIIKAVKNKSTVLKTSSARDRDRQWLFIYQTWSVRELKGKGQTFLALLKEKGFVFLKFPVTLNGIPDSI